MRKSFSFCKLSPIVICVEYVSFRECVLLNKSPFKPIKYCLANIIDTTHVEYISFAIIVLMDTTPDN